jgi:uncharacterized protein
MPESTPESTTRRSFLKRTAAIAAVTAVSRRAPAFQLAPTTRSTPLTQFNYADVQLLDGPMLVQFRNNHTLFLNLNEDSMLKPFRQLTGMPAPGEDMGGWYSPSPLFDPGKNMTGYVPGHTFGQYVSGLARAYAVTGDKPTQQKVHRLVTAYAATVSPKFYEGYCLPAYTSDKITCGLIDAHQFAADPVALDVLNKATDVVLPFLPPKALNRDEMQARPMPNIAFGWDESYTLPENFYLAYQRGAGPRFRQLASRFLEDDTYFNPLSEDQNVLPGQHAYSHLNALSSAMQAYLTDGSDKHLRAAQNGFRFVREQSFATGGWGPNETFCTPGSNQLAESLDRTHAGFETPCGAYGHFKITRCLLRVTGDSTYGDSMEAVLYNTILGALPIRPDGVSFYYADYNNHDAHKFTHNDKWPCCSGTFPQLTADYGISSYFHSPDALYVNLYVPSRVSWKQGSANVSLTQNTQYPNIGHTQLHLQSDRAERFTIALRIPAWAGPHTALLINGKKSDQPLQPGTFAKIDRTWNNNDRLELAIDMPLRLVPIDANHPNLVALVRGPVALFAIAPNSTALTTTALLAAQPKNTANDWEVSTTAGPILLRPYASITDEHYRLYHQT